MPAFFPAGGKLDGMVEPAGARMQPHGRLVQNVEHLLPSPAHWSSHVKSPFGIFQGGADDAHASPGAAERVPGYRAWGPSRRDAEVAMVCAFLARFSSRAPPSSSGLLPPHLLHSRGLFGSADA